MIATREQPRVAVGVRRVERARVLPWLGLGFALALSAVLNLWNLGQNGYGDIYYSVAVQSMMQNWRNFFFAAYDAGGFISVDKPPVALWAQVVSAKIFGFSGFALILPSVLAGVAAVALVFFLVKRLFGALAGTVAAVALAITPIAVSVQRDNETDSLLMLALILAAWAVTLATEKGKLALLALGMALVGVGFNIKMLEAWIILPVFFGLYLIAAPIKWWKRLLHLTLAGLVALVVSLSWAVAVDLTPAADRPWVGGSQSNSVLELAFGYNGLARITGNNQGGAGRGGNFGGGNFNGGQFNGGGRGGFNGGGFNGGNTGISGTIGGANGLFGAGYAGVTRLFNGGILAEQWSWLFPLGLSGTIAAALAIRRRNLLGPRTQALMLWGGWLGIYGAVFSMASGTFHPYYLIMLAPAAAALAGIGLGALWRAYKRGGWQGWLLPLTLLATAAWQISILREYPQWAAWLAPLLLGGTLLAAGLLAAARLLALDGMRRALPALLALGLVAVMVSPLAWATTTVLAAPNNASLPVSGPDSLTDTSSSWTKLGTTSQALISYLQANTQDYLYLVAVGNAQESSALALDSGRPVLATAGFMGTDPALTVEQLEQMVARKQLRYVLGLANSGGGMRGMGQSSNSAVSSWITANCSAVDPSAYGGSTGTNRGGGFTSGLAGTLYDCAVQ